ncbi:hypothetical protein [Methanospirillum sp.]|uniref:hypothetical protein n=1 Tax=Methanospirillum sp. TaxID=45200 RepID=UPI0035A1CD2A
MDPDTRDSQVQTIMATISSLMASRRIEDKIRSASLLSQYSKVLPSQFLDRILEDLKKDTHYEIQEALEPLLKVEEEISPVPISNKEIITGYSGSLENALKKALEITNIFDLSQVTAKAIRQQLIDGKNGSENALYSDFIHQKSKMTPDLALFPQISLKVSPIGALAEVIRIIPELSKKSATGKVNADRKIIETKLDEILETEQEISFNIAGYELLYTLERMMRDLIQQRIITPHVNNLQTKIPSDVLEGMKKRKDIEENNPISIGKYELIEYCDFTDLKKILEKGRNHEFFSDIFSFEEIKTVYSKLGELDPIRKKIAHSRPMTRKEFERLRLYATDILDKINK